MRKDVYTTFLRPILGLQAAIANILCHWATVVQPWRAVHLVISLGLPPPWPIAVTSFYILDSVETKPGPRLNQSLSCPTKVAVQVALLRLGFLSQDRVFFDCRMVPVALQNQTFWPSIDPKSI